MSNAVIESQIKTYFPDFGEKTEAKLTWTAFSDTVDNYYSDIFGAYHYTLYSGPKMLKYKDELQNLQNEKEEIILQIQNSSVSGLSEHLFRRFIRNFMTLKRTYPNR